MLVILSCRRNFCLFLATRRSFSFLFDYPARVFLLFGHPMRITFFLLFDRLKWVGFFFRTVISLTHSFSISEKQTITKLQRAAYNNV